MNDDASAQCRNCRHFRSDAVYLETVFPGLISLSSGYGSVRGNDGVCQLHDRYLRASYGCGKFWSREDGKTGGINSSQ